MKKKTTRLLSFVLALAMVFGMLPATELHAHAAAYTWDPDATMTLKCGDTVVEPKEVIETADTKLKVYQIESILDYTLTTSADNDYAVMFEVNWSVISEDEYGYKDYDYEMTVTLDNVTIRTYNPRVGQNAGIHAAMTFSDEKSEERYETLNIELVGNNTVELLGVKDDSADDRWSAVSFIGPNTVIKGEGTLNAAARYSNAVGAVSALYTENSVGLYDSVTLNATADVKAKDADALLGDGLYFDDYEFIMEAGTAANIMASGSGIMHGTQHVRAKWLDDMIVDGNLDIRAADYGISWQAGGIYMGDGTTLSVKGLSAASVPNVGILVRRGVFVGEGCTLKVDALGSAVSCRAVTTANPSAPLTVGKNSVVELSGSVDSNVFVLDCGTKLAGTNNVVSGTGEEWYGESYPVSELILEEGAKLTINGGYLALRAALMELKNGSELDIRTEKYPESENVEESMSVYISTSQSYVRNGAKLNIEVASDYAIYGFTGLYLESDNVYLKAADSALYSGLGLYRGTDPVIYTFESDDGINWIPFANKNSKAYFTTKEPTTHICAASVPANTYSNKAWTPIESEYKHTAKCIYCAADIVADCQWDRGAWSYSSGVYTLKFECEICEQERYSDVEYHSHVFETWTPLMGDYYPMHESTCTVPGCGASTESYCSDSYSEEFHVSMTTLRKNCTKCGQYTEREIDISAVEITHVEAKPATCGEVGNTEFWICGHCNQYFSDESCQHVVTPAQVYISPSEHTYVNNVCSVCESEIKSARFEQSMDDTFSSDDCYLYVLIGEGSDGKLYAMGEATADGRRYGVEIPSAQIDANGIVTLNAGQAEFMDFEYYFENGSGATTTSTFMVDGNYMTARYGKIYTFPQDRLDDKNNPRPFSFRLESYSGESSLGYVDCDLYDPSDYSHTHEYITFNPETHYFEACEDRQYTVYLYRQVCDHEDIYLTHSTPVAPTCTEQGFSGDFWECTMCGKMFTDKSCSTELELPEDVYNIAEYFLSPALGHDFNAGGVCENCGMKRHVYTQVSTLAEFDALSEDASYIIVFKDGDKTYAAYIPNWNIFNKMITADSDGDGLIDLLEPDANANGIPDIVEDYIDTQRGGADADEDGTTTADEYKQAIGSLDDDDDVDVEDYKQFFAWHIESFLREEFEEEHATNHPNVVEVTVAADGSITITDEGAMEFQMMPSGIWGGQEYDDSELEYEGIKETERLRAAWVPNAWIANYGTMGQYSEEHFLTQNRWFGDHFAPGVVDNKNWRISFNGDGTAMLVSTWTNFDDSAALQLVKYTDADGNERITMVGCYGELWQNSDILSNCTVISGAYLYASEPVYDVPPHECIWSDWEDDDVTDTYTRECTVEGCDKKQTENHNWDNGTETEAPTCTEPGTLTYTCPDCNAEKTESIPALDHDWNDWTDTGNNAVADIHERTCQRDGCDAKEIGNHEWGDWISTGATEHKKTCSVCSGERTAIHAWDSGEVTKEATVKETGVKLYTCADCGSTKTEVIPKVVCDHSWDKWQADNDETHTHICVNGNGCTAYQQQAHVWNDGEVTTEPTETTEGVMTYVCLVCSHEKTEAIAMLEHTHNFGDWVSDGADTHTRKCGDGTTCTAAETEPHTCDAWADNEDGTHSGKCAVCGAGIVEDHIWSDWTVGVTEDQYIRHCKCGAAEEMTVQKPVDESVTNTTNAETNAAGADLVVEDAEELFNNALTTEEQSAVAGGSTTVSIYLEVTDIPVSEISSSDKAAIEMTIEESDNPLDEKTEIGMYLDINLFKEVTTTDDVTSKTETESSQITETADTVTITIQIPEELINTDLSVLRVYRVIRIHEDEDGNLITDVIEGVFDPETGLFTFETDKFSTYALAYNDSEARYTVTYTDGVDGTTVFEDQVFADVLGGSETPAFAGVPSRDGYIFMGWAPAVSEMVTKDEIYTATWKKNNTGIIIVKPTTKPEEPAFDDLVEDSYYYDAVLWAVENGITEGTGENKFSPEAVCTRAQMVTFLWRAAGSPEPIADTCLFTDVDMDSYYGKAVLWAVENGITNGTSATTFDPDGVCTRAQMATFICRMADGEPAGTTNGFIDVAADTYYAEAVQWAVEQGITNGTGNNRFSPDADCTRAQMVTFLYRYLNKA